MSPDGEHIAVSVHNTEKGEDSYQLAVLHLPDLKFISRLDMTSKYLPIDITWVDNKRLVLGIGEGNRLLGSALGPTGDVIAVDMRRQEQARCCTATCSRGSMEARARYC